MIPPNGRRPQDVAPIRDSIVEEYKSGRLGELLANWQEVSEANGRNAPTDAAVEMSGFDSARLFWLPPEETAAIVEGAGDLPEELVLTSDMVPYPSGFVVFGGDWHGTDSVTGTKSMLSVRALKWGPVMLPTYFPEGSLFGHGIADVDHPFVEGIALSAYGYSGDIRAALRMATDEELDRIIDGFSFPRHPKIRETLRDREDGDHPSWNPLGRSDWALNQHWRDHVLYSPSDTAYASIIEDRAIIAALWGLMASCPPHDVLPDRAERHRAARRGCPAPPVRVITWRGPRGETLASGESSGDRKLTKRFVVRPHWRHQAHGPGRSLRRWVYVPRHWRGPEDGEVADPHTLVTKIVGRK